MKFGAAALSFLLAGATVVSGSSLRRELADNWYELDRTPGQHPENLIGDGKAFTMTVKPDQEAVKIHSTDVS